MNYSSSVKSARFLFRIFSKRQVFVFLIYYTQNKIDFSIVMSPENSGRIILQFTKNPQAGFSFVK